MDLLEWKEKYYQENEYIVLYGSSSGIGFEYMKILAEAQINIIAISNEKARLDVQTSELAKRYKIKIKSLYSDLTNLEEIKSIADYLQTNQSQGAVINAGFGVRKLPNDNKMLLIKNIITLSSIGPSMILQAVLPKLKQRNKGLVINISSAPARIDGVCAQVHKASKAFWESLNSSLKKHNRSANIYFQLVLTKTNTQAADPYLEIQSCARTAKGSVNSLHKLVYSSSIIDRFVPYLL